MPLDAPSVDRLPAGIGTSRSRPRILTASTVVGALIAGLAFALATCGADPAKPDVLVLVLDTVRADRLSVLECERETTPHLQRFAEGAIVFEDAWGPASWTLPAHAALFTGMHPSDVGLADGAVLSVDGDVPLLAELLRTAGWATACFTANSWIGPHTGLARGFGRVDELWKELGGTDAARTHERAFDWMQGRRKRGTPFFAFVNDMEAHAPWNPPPQARERFVRPGHPAWMLARLSSHSILDPPDGGVLFGVDYPGVRDAARDLYDGEIAGLDEEVGRLLERMRVSGLLDNTLVVIVSDHGEGLGEHGWMEHGFSLHREILRVPLIVRLPGGSASSRVSDVVLLEDVLPTILEVCGLGAPEGLRGESLLAPRAERVAMARMRVPPEVMPRTEEVLGPERAPLAHSLRTSVYDGRWHLLESDAGESELFDVHSDPAEVNNLFADRPDEVERLRALLRSRSGRKPL